MWVNYRIHQKTKEIEYRTHKDGRITWVKDKNDPDIIDRGTEKEAKLTKLRIMKPYDEYGYHHGELKSADQEQGGSRSETDDNV